MFFILSGDFMTVLFWETGMLVAALSADAFAAGLAYGAGGIRLPAVSAFTASAVSSVILAFSFLLGRMAGGALSEGMVKAAGFLILTALGIWKLVDGAGGKDAEEADKNRDRRLSPAEALVLGAALSADSLAAGIGAGAFDMPIFPAAAASFAAGVAALFLGCRLGRSLSVFEERTGRKARGGSCNFGERAGGRISGLLLVILAFSKLL